MQASGQTFRPRKAGLFQAFFLMVPGVVAASILGWLTLTAAHYGAWVAVIPFGLLTLACLILVVSPLAYFFGASVTVSSNNVVKSWPIGIRRRTCLRDELWFDSYQMDTGGQLMSFPYTVYRFHQTGGQKRFSLGSNWWPIQDILFELKR